MTDSTPEAVVDDLQALVPVLFTAVEAGTQEAALFFEERDEPIDPYLFPNMVRWRARRELERAEIDAVEDEECSVDPRLANNGILIKHRGYTLRLLKAGDNGDVPPPGPSKPRQSFYNQPLFGDTEFVNLVVVWTYRRDTRAVELELTCPKSADAYSNVSLHFRIVLEHPAIALPPAIAIGEPDADLTDLKLRVRPAELRPLG